MARATILLVVPPYILLASERSERDTIRSVQICAGAVYVNVIARVRVKFVPEISRLAMPLKINTLDSLLFI